MSVILTIYLCCLFMLRCFQSRKDLLTAKCQMFYINNRNANDNQNFKSNLKCVSTDQQWIKFQPHVNISQFLQRDVRKKGKRLVYCTCSHLHTNPNLQYWYLIIYSICNKSNIRYLNMRYTDCVRLFYLIYNKIFQEFLQIQWDYFKP